ncbi:MAG: phosphatidate cytidylyltransferase [Bifidobacteriaceae bacterium]|jgi:phosphatidate cytidylyltransferase|nr:phosphatidate cytidylyltransferase [Bifidobacteriaceae bacterium]
MAAPDTQSTAPAKRGRDLAVAVPTAIGLIVALAAALAFNPWPFVGLVAVALILALRELAQALAGVGLHIPYWPLLVGGVFTQVAAARTGVPGVVVGIFLTLAASVLWRVLEGDYRPASDAVEAPASGQSPAAPPVRRRRRPVAGAEGRGLTGDICAIAFATVYLPTLAALVVLLSFYPDGRWLVALLVAVPVASDTGGYFAGSYFGRHKLAAKISPQKTWEGLAGSIALALVAGVGGMALMGRPWYFGVALAVLGALTATLGDLAESLLKRAIGVKDMGSLLPGHGGVLDRVDSILMTAPVFYAVIALFGAEVFG